jgi:hypothetical protein
MPKLITVTEMIRSFSDIVGRVHYKGEIFDIKKGANIVARLSPAKAKLTVTAGELNELFKSAPHLSEEDIEEFEQDIAKLKALKDTGGFNKWE